MLVSDGSYGYGFGALIAASLLHLVVLVVQLQLCRSGGRGGYTSA
jgi:hypothetical protein